MSERMKQEKQNVNPINEMELDAALGAPVVLHRASRVDAAGRWYHVYPRGEFPASLEIGGKTQQIVEVFDDAAFASILEAHRALAADPEWPGYLVGEEHFAAMQDKSSRAAAWARELEVRSDGLWAHFDKTPFGEQIIGSQYKFRSGVSHMRREPGTNRFRPVDLVDIGLTNKPKLGVRAATHRDGAAPQHKEDAMLAEARAILSMPEEATEEQILEQIKTVAHRAAEAEAAQARADAAEQKLATIAHRQLEADADAFVSAHAERIADPAVVRASFISHREQTEATFAALKPQEHRETQATQAAQLVLHRADAATPAARLDAPEQDRSARQSSYVEQIRIAHRCATHVAALNLARALNPALFA